MLEGKAFYELHTETETTALGPRHSWPYEMPAPVDRIISLWEVSNMFKSRVVDPTQECTQIHSVFF